MTVDEPLTCQGKLASIYGPPKPIAAFNPGGVPLFTNGTVFTITYTAPVGDSCFGWLILHLDGQTPGGACCAGNVQFNLLKNGVSVGIYNFGVGPPMQHVDIYIANLEHFSGESYTYQLLYSASFADVTGTAELVFP